MSGTEKKVLGLGVRYRPACIGVHYREKGQNKLYNIRLNRLLYTPNSREAAVQLYKQHPKFLNEKEVPLHRVSQLIQKIQDETKVFDEYDKDFELNEKYEQGMYDDYDYEDEQPYERLNRSR